MLLVNDYLIGVEVADVLFEWQPMNTGMLDSEVDFIILLGRGVMYDFDLILVIIFHTILLTLL